MDDATRGSVAIANARSIYRRVDVVRDKLEDLPTRLHVIACELRAGAETYPSGPPVRS